MPSMMPKRLLQAFGKLVGGGLSIGEPYKWRTRWIGFLLSICSQASFMCCMTSSANGVAVRIGVGFAGHVADALAQTSVAKGDRGVAAAPAACRWSRPFSDGQEHRTARGSAQRQIKYPLKRLWRQHQGAIAQIKTLIENFPEVFLKSPPEESATSR